MESQVPDRVDLISGVHVHAALKCQLEEDTRRETDMRVLWLAEGLECAVGWWLPNLLPSNSACICAIVFERKKEQATGSCPWKGWIKVVRRNKSCKRRTPAGASSTGIHEV